MGGIVGGMEKTTVYLSQEQKAALSRAAQSEGRSEATLIRAGIDAVTARHRMDEAAARHSVAKPGTGEDEEAAPRRPRWVTRDLFLRDIVGIQADPGLRAELRDLAPDTTDDLPDR